MSYILDALKKSDQERQQKNGPDLQTIHRPHRVDKKRGGIFWLVSGFSLAGILVVAALLWYLLTVSDISFPQTQTSAISVLETPVAAAEKNTMASKPTALPAAANQSTTNQSTTTNTVMSTASTASESDFPVVEFWELPAPIQKAIPALTFSFHVYSDNPDRRTIIINKHRVKEGDLIEHGLLLEEITQEGVVLRWEQRRFIINVVEGW